MKMSWSSNSDCVLCISTQSVTQQTNSAASPHKGSLADTTRKIDSLNRTDSSDSSAGGSSSSKGKIKVHTLDIAPLRSESQPQKRSGMTRVLKVFQFYLHTHTFIRNGNEPYLPLP